MQLELNHKIDLATQLESVVDAGRLSAAAMSAHRALEDVLLCPVVEQESYLSRLNLPLLSRLNVNEDSGLIVAVLCVTHLELLKAAKPGDRMTASENIRTMSDTLAKRYDADL